MSVGERIQTLRKERGISQAQLADALDLSRQAVSKWENDLAAPDTINLIRLADILNIDVEFLATGNHSPKKPPVHVVTVLQKVDKVVEKVVEKPVLVEKTVEVEKIVERSVKVPVVKRVIRTKYIRNPLEFFVLGTVCFLVGLLIGILI